MADMGQRRDRQNEGRDRQNPRGDFVRNRTPREASSQSYDFERQSNRQEHPTDGWWLQWTGRLPGERLPPRANEAQVHDSSSSDSDSDTAPNRAIEWVPSLSTVESNWSVATNERVAAQVESNMFRDGQQTGLIRTTNRLSNVLDQLEQPRPDNISVTALLNQRKVSLEALQQWIEPNVYTNYMNELDTQLSRAERRNR